MIDPIRYVKNDYKHYQRAGNVEKIALCEYILRALYKQAVMPVPIEYYESGKCHSCHTLNQHGNYCSNCGQRLK